MIRRRADLVAATLFTVATAVVLGGRLDRSFNFDEAVNTAQVIQFGSPGRALSGGDSFNNHPVYALGQSIWWAIGGQGEARQRVIPVLYGALAVGLLAGWAVRRFGLLAGISAGTVVALNPMFVEQARNSRGYGLVVLGVVVAVIALIEYVRQDDPRWLVAHSLAVIVVLGTHTFGGIGLGAVGLAAIAYMRRVDPLLVGAWLCAAAGTALIYASSFSKLAESVDERGSLYRDWLASVTFWELLGRDRATAATIGVGLTVGLVVLVQRTDLQVPTVVVARLVGMQFWVFWQMIKPFDLYPRFFLALLPLVAIGVAVAVQKVRALAALVTVGLLFTLGNVIDERGQETPIRQMAALIDRARADGLSPCAVGGFPTQVYTQFPTELIVTQPVAPDVFDGCDVFVRVGSWGRPLLSPAREHFAYEGRIEDALEVFANVPLEQLNLNG